MCLAMGGKTAADEGRLLADVPGQDEQQNKKH